MNRSGVVFLLAGAAVLAGLFLLFRPAAEPTAPAVTATAPATTPADPVTAVAPPPALPVAKVFELVVKQRHLVSGPEVLQVTQGDEVHIAITVDQAEELHLHGYNLKADIKPGVRAVLSFVADHSGRFEYELEKSRTELGALEVQPK